MKRAVISFPKSGRTWLRYALLHAAPRTSIVYTHSGFEYNDGLRPPLNFSLPYHLAHVAHVDRFVFVARDPRDVAVSLYHQVTGRFRDFFQYSGDIGAFIRDGYFGIDNIVRFQMIWLQIVEMQPKGMVVWYEDMAEDFAGSFGAVAEHMDLGLTTADIARVSEAARFDNMREVERTGRFPQPWLRLRNGAPKVRKGKVGGHREELSPEDCAYLDQRITALRHPLAA